MFNMKIIKKLELTSIILSIISIIIILYFSSIEDEDSQFMLFANVVFLIISSYNYFVLHKDI